MLPELPELDGLRLIDRRRLDRAPDKLTLGLAGYFCPNCQKRQ